MIFDYPEKPLERKHGPAGYAGYQSYKPWLRDDFHFRCVYCLQRESWSNSGDRAFVIDHFLPQADNENLICDYDNLCYACSTCNAHKSDRHLEVDPCRRSFSKYLKVEANGEITAHNTAGQKLIEILQLNDEVKAEFREKLLDLYQRAKAKGDKTLLKRWFGYPSNLPNLARLRPPRNIKREGLDHCFYQHRRKGSLPDVY